jgi:outer membrane protein OmpA-like peptidoglycan-associated protein
MAPPAPRQPAGPQVYTVYFDFNRSTLASSAIPVIDQAAASAKQNNVTRIQVIGHADRAGSDAYNQRLSERRADSVGLALRDYGVSFARIETSGMGEFEPIATNATEWGRAQNRRVEISIKSEKD